jgi:hypothetical protein
MLSDQVEHVELNGAAQTEETATEQASLHAVALLRSLLVSAVVTCFYVIHLFLLMARKVDEAANFLPVQLTEQEPGIYDKCDADFGRQDKIDLAWDRISHEIKESGS